jgi:hypothetical protein
MSEMAARRSNIYRGEKGRPLGLVVGLVGPTY